jgi:NAD+ diphosphatase
MTTAFFFQDDNLLLPEGFSEMDRGIPLELAGVFKNSDIFKIPSIDVNDLKNDIYAVYVAPECELPDNWEKIQVRQTLSLSPENLDRMLRAFHIAQWRRESRFCGSCGARNIDTDELHRLCPICGRHEFPRISPAVLVVITDNDNRILLAHNKKFKHCVYSHISGFVEAGETAEDTIIREVREEISINVSNPEYIKSQPWPFPNSLMLGFKAKYQSGEITVDGVEIEDAGWFTKDNLPQLPAAGSLSRFLIEKWLRGIL